MKKRFHFSLLTALLTFGMGISVISCDQLAPKPTSSQGNESSPVEPISNSDVSHSSGGNSSKENSSEESKEDSKSEEVHTHVWGDPTWEWTKTNDSYTAKAKFTCTVDRTHVETVDAQVSKGAVKEATCTEAGSAEFTATATHDGKSFTDKKTDRVDALNHALVHHDAKAATCTEDGWAAYDTCSRCDFTTYKKIDKLGHDFDTEWQNDANEHWHVCKRGCGEVSDKGAHVLKTREVVTDPTCAQEGSKKVETYCEVCGLVTATEITAINKVSHKYVLDEQKSVAPTCTTAGSRVYTCESCKDSYSEPLTALGHDYQFVSCTSPYKCSRCDATKEAPGHDYHVDTEHSHQVTCTEDGAVRYVCSKCDDFYESKTPAEGHNLEGEWEFKETVHDETTKCLDHDIYKNYCSKCQQQVEKTEDVYRHQYIAKITKNASCVEKGEKQYVCKVCGALEKKEEIAISADAHNWDEGTKVGNVTTFHCQNEGCNATKTSVVAEEKNIAVSSSDFAAVEEVKLTNAALAFDEASKGLLEGKDLKIEVKETTAGEITIQEGQNVEIPADTKVYDFSITDTSDNPLAFSGEGSGKVTVRLPYEIQEGEDADNLIIYYVDADGKVAEFEAKYENGFAVFETTHFSYYLVSYMTPEQACAKFGHRWGDTVTVEAGCLNRGYQYEVCSRCGLMNIHDEVAPLGHKFVVDEAGSKEPTCTEPGYSGVYCEHCHEQYGEYIPATGHNYQQKEVVSPTCTNAGSVTYECSECHDQIVTPIPAKGHTFVAQTTPATCKAEGKIEYVCKDCGVKDESRTVVLEKLEHDYVLDHETDEEYVYKCSYECGETKVVSKNAAPLTEETALHKHVFTNTAKSIEGKDLSVHSGDFFIRTKTEGSTLIFGATDSEAHIGIDENGNLLAYASTNFERDGEKGSAAILLMNNKVYIELSSSYGKEYMTYDLSTIGSAEFNLGDVLNNVPNIINYLDTDVKAFLDNLLDANDEKLNKTIYHALDQLFTFKSTPTGYDISLDFDKVSAFVNKLNTKSIAECIDTLLGEGKTQELLNDFGQYTSLSLYDALAKIKEDYGFDYEEFIRLIDKAVKIITDKETLRDLIWESSDNTVDINEYLSEEYLKANSINSLVRDTEWAANFLNDKLLSEFIVRDIKELLDKNIYEFLENMFGMSEEMLEDVKEHINEYVGLLKESNSKVVLKLGENGEFNSFNVVLDLNNDDITLVGDLQVYFGSDYRSVRNYNELYRLAENVNRIIKEEKFSTNEKILSHFDEDAIVEKDAAGNIIKVTVNKHKAHYYDKPQYGEETQRNNFVVESEEDLFELVERDDYKEIVNVYKQYASLGQMRIVRANFDTYEITKFEPSNLRFHQICGNKYDYEYSLPAMYEGRYNSILITVTDAEGNELYNNIFSTSSYKYSETFEWYNGSVDLASNKIIEGQYSGHSYILVEDTLTPETKCGDKVTRIYVCADCGDVRDESYVMEHSDIDRDNIISEKLIGEYPRCYYGVEITYLCDKCGEEITVTRNDHYPYEKVAFETDTGLKISQIGCACGSYEDEYNVDGYYKVSGYNYFKLQKENTEEYEDADVMIYMSKDYEDGVEPLMVLIDERYESKPDCTYQISLVVYEGCHMVNGVMVYATKSVIPGEQGEQHGRTYYVKDSFKPVDPNDLSKGYNYQEKCEACGEILNYEAVDPNSYHGLMIKLEDLGYTHTYGGYIYIVARADELYKLFTTGSCIADHCDINAYGCEFNNDEFKEGEVWYGLHCCCVSDQEAQEGCTFKFAESHDRITTKIDDHTSARYREMRIGCDDYGKNALLTLKIEYESYSSHNYVPGEPETIDTDNENIKFKVSTATCSCGETTSYTQLAVTGQMYEEDTRIEGEDGLIYYYQAGYNKDLGLGRYYVVDQQGREIREVYSQIYGDGDKEYQFYNIYTQINSYGYYENLQYIKGVTSIEYYYNTRNTEVSRTNTDITNYYYPFEAGDDFNNLFLEITGFEYNMDKYGCYRIIENVSKDGNKRYQLERFHIAMEFTGDKLSCTQYNDYHCVICGKTESRPPHGHEFHYDYQLDHYVCDICGTESYNSYNGDIVLEDLKTVEDGKVTIGYCFPNMPELNGKSISELDAQVHVVVNFGTYRYEQTLYDLPIYEACVGKNGMIEIDVDELFGQFEQMNIHEKDVNYIQIYFEGKYYNYNYGYGVSLYANIIISAAELGIDTTRHYQSANFDYLPNVSSTAGTLEINPSNKTIKMTLGENVIEGRIQDGNGNYYYFEANGEYYYLEGYSGKYNEHYLRYYVGDNEETYESEYVYFLEEGTVIDTSNYHEEPPEDPYYEGPIYYSAANFEYLPNVDERSAALELCPEKDYYIIYIEGEMIQGKLLGFYGDSANIAFNGEEYVLEPYLGQYDELYLRMFASYDEETGENYYFYFLKEGTEIQVPEYSPYGRSSFDDHAESGFGLIFSDGTYMSGYEADEYEGFRQYVLVNRHFDKGQQFRLCDFGNDDASWTVDINPWSFGGDEENLAWAKYIRYENEIYTAITDFDVEYIYLKIKNNQDEIYFQLP